MNHMTTHYDEVKIRQLLERYYLGETSVEEEGVLIDYFTNCSDIPEDLEGDAEIFRLMSDAKNEFFEAELKRTELAIPEGMDERLKASIEKLENPPKIGFYRWKHAIAACVVLAVTFLIGNNLLFGTPDEFVYKDTCKTPEEAAMQMNRALSMLNAKTCAGLEEVERSHTSSAKALDKNISKFISFD